MSEITKVKWNIRDLTPEERQKYEQELKDPCKRSITLKYKPENYSYCGPFYMPEKIRDDLSGSFNTACRIHDLDYEEKKITRAEADLKFYEGMMTQAKGMKDIVLAKVFYFFVKNFGWISWR